MKMNTTDLKDMIKRKGAENIVFIVPMLPVRRVLGVVTSTSTSDKLVNVECVIDESKYKLEDNYKITLQAKDRKYGSDDFYQSDLASLISEGKITVK